LAPLSLSALLLTLVLLFGLQGEQILRQPLVIALLAVPILLQVYFNAGLAYWLNRRLGVAWCSMATMMMASLRASATRALRMVDRRAMSSAHVLSARLPR
jgi:ACR3 family arsenite efflux pump ArsB